MDTTAVDAILARIPALGENEVRVLHAAWDGGDSALRQRAWKHGKPLLARRSLEDRYRDAADLVRRWTSDHTLVRTRTSAITFGLIPSFIEKDWLDLRIAAAPALLDAILGSLVGDELAPEERDELLGPWLEATSHPAPVADAWTGEAAEDDEEEEKAREEAEGEAAQG
jgi:hypothetical protein